MSSFAREIVNVSSKYVLTALVAAPFGIFYAVSAYAWRIESWQLTATLLFLAVGTSEICWKILQRPRRSQAVHVADTSVRLLFQTFEAVSGEAPTDDAISEFIQSCEMHFDASPSTTGVDLVGMTIESLDDLSESYVTQANSPTATPAHYIARRLEAVHAVS